MHFYAAVILSLAIIDLAEQKEQSVRSGSKDVPPSVLDFKFETKPTCKPQPLNNTISGVYSETTEKCCLGTVLSKEKVPDGQCCGTSIIDPSKELCCEHKPTALKPGHKCCGSKTYHPDASVCCKGQVLDVSKDDQKFKHCCGDKRYDSKTQDCCDDGEGTTTVLDSKDGHSCCGDKLYNEKTEVCCVDPDKPNSRIAVTKKDSSHDKCCGKIPIQFYAEGCCSGKPFSHETHGCCNNHIYDKKSEVCCQYSSLVKTSDPAQDKCCGKKPYNSKKEICCDGKLITKISDTDDDCCGSVSFNSETGMCCNGVLFENVTSEIRDVLEPVDIDVLSVRRPFELKPVCCGSKLLDTSKDSNTACCGLTDIYDKTTQLCCSNFGTDAFNLVAKAAGGSKTGCCGLKAYDKNKQICCSTYVNDRKDVILDKLTDSPRDTGCCGLEAYDKKTQICCNDFSKTPTTNAVIDKPKEDKEASERDIFPFIMLNIPRIPIFGCCNLKLYRHGKEICCGGKIVANTGNNACCGTKIYEMDKEDCCGSEIYEKAKETCCVRKVFPKKEGQDSCCSYGTTDEDEGCIKVWSLEF